MPVTPNFLERLLLLRLNKGPAPMLDLFGAGGFKAVTLALDMGLFEELAASQLSVTRLAETLGADEHGVEALLAFLEANGYVTEDDSRYGNTATTTKWLTEDSKTNVGPFLTFWDDLVFPLWEQQLETAVREGEPSQTMFEWFDEKPSRWKTAQRGFRAAASVMVDEVTDKVSVPDGATDAIDVGGGHGLYSIELCRRHPELSATVFDNPEALDLAREEIDGAGLTDRIETQGGDYWTDDMGAGYDLALLFNVIHSNNAERNVRLFERVADTLRPGGRIVLLDQLAGSSSMPVGKAGLGFLGLTYLVTVGADVHPYDEVAEWLHEAGFENVQKTSIRRAGPGNTLIEATKERDGS